MVFFFKKKYNAQITVTSKRKINFMIFSSSLFGQCKICRNKFVIRTVFYIEEETNLKKNDTFVNYWPFQSTKIVKKQENVANKWFDAMTEGASVWNCRCIVVDITTEIVLVCTWYLVKMYELITKRRHVLLEPSIICIEWDNIKH